MVRTRFALILYIRIRLHAILCQRLFEINEDMVQVQLMLEVLFRILRLKICSVVLLSALNPACSSAIISSAWGLSLFKMNFSMTLLE